ncbi:hypothetical protein F4778DRAFT_643407 [Xylariomycetidae sp. FL2044]|nr:hypothetical protein F4778DRAFT_643407 [Xylariomycetidae sp. FL2044]
MASINTIASYQAYQQLPERPAWITPWQKDNQGNQIIGHGERFCRHASASGAMCSVKKPFATMKTLRNHASMHGRVATTTSGALSTREREELGDYYDRLMAHHRAMGNKKQGDAGFALFTIPTPNRTAAAVPSRPTTSTSQSQAQPKPNKPSGPADSTSTSLSARSEVVSHDREQPVVNVAVTSQSTNFSYANTITKQRLKTITMEEIEAELSTMRTRMVEAVNTHTGVLRERYRRLIEERDARRRKGQDQGGGQGSG